jgi:hypothetical protein
MVFANNAVYCPGSAAVDASGIDGGTFRANYVEGRLVGAAVDGAGFCDGGAVSAAFASPAERDYWLGAGSVLIDRGDPDFACDVDFNGTLRKPPFDVGAYESAGLQENPGWQVKGGFKAKVRR